MAVRENGRPWRYAVPVVVLIGLLVVFAVGLQLEPSRIPSPLIGKPMPAFELPVLVGGQGTMTHKNLIGRPLLVNFFASWCPPCLQEHPFLMELAASGVVIAGFNYKDEPADGLGWLQRHGNPYEVVLSDLGGRAGLDWGVYGAPETYVIDANGVIVYKHVGPLTRADWNEKVVTALGWKP